MGTPLRPGGWGGLQGKNSSTPPPPLTLRPALPDTSQVNLPRPQPTVPPNQPPCQVSGLSGPLFTNAL